MIFKYTKNHLFYFHPQDSLYTFCVRVFSSFFCGDLIASHAHEPEISRSKESSKSSEFSEGISNVTYKGQPLFIYKRFTVDSNTQLRALRLNFSK